MENKTSKYLKYAIGEIVLVVIGILIALQVNNWNEGRKELKESELIKQNIHEEFLKNQELLKDSQKSNKGAFSANKILTNLVGSDKSELAKHNLDSLFNASLMADTYLPTSNSLEDIMQLGRMNVLHDNDLKNTILSWKAALDLFREYYRIQNNWYNNQYFPFILPIISFSQMDMYNGKSWAKRTKLKTDYLPVFQDIKFENILENNLFLIDYMLNKLDDIEKYQEKIIELTQGNKQ